MNSKKFISYFIFLLVVINLIISIVIFSTSILSNNQGFCLVGSQENCISVQTSQYSNILGIPVTVYGIITFTCIIILLLISLFKEFISPKIIFVIKILFLGSSVSALWFLYVMFFLLKHICSSCIWVDVTTILTTVLFFVYKPLNK